MSESKVTKHFSSARRFWIPNLNEEGEKTQQHICMSSNSFMVSARVDKNVWLEYVRVCNYVRFETSRNLPPVLFCAAA